MEKLYLSAGVKSGYKMYTDLVPSLRLGSGFCVQNLLAACKGNLSIYQWNPQWTEPAFLKAADEERSLPIGR